MGPKKGQKSLFPWRRIFDKITAGIVRGLCCAAVLARAMRKQGALERFFDPENSLIKKLAFIIIGLFLLYVIAGFWVVPPCSSSDWKNCWAIKPAARSQLKLLK
jgi:hypothetical protein